MKFDHIKYMKIHLTEFIRLRTIFEESKLIRFYFFNEGATNYPKINPIQLAMRAALRSYMWHRARLGGISQ